MIAKTIQIFLPDGNPRSIKIAEITSRTIQAILIPRFKLVLAAEREELKNVGVYFLVGSPEDHETASIYIGEAEDCLKRLQQHNRNKDFWNLALVIVSKTQFFTKTHVKYLEWLSYKKATKTNRFRIVNTNVPSKPFTPEPVEADLADNFETLKILVSTLGYPILEEIKKPQRDGLFFCTGKNARAEGEYSEDGMIVFKGSEASLKESKSLSTWLKGLRQKLISDAILVEQNGAYKFTKDHIFNSPSAASGTVLGRSSNGWTDWKDKSGNTLDKIQRQAE